MTTKAQTERAEAIAKLREWIKPGDTVYTIMRHVTRSGYGASVSVILMEADGPCDVSYLVRQVLGLRMDADHGGVKTDDRHGSVLIGYLARVLHGSSTALNQVEL